MIFQDSWKGISRNALIIRMETNTELFVIRCSEVKNEESYYAEVLPGKSKTKGNN